MTIVIDNSNLYAGGGIQVATSFMNDLNSIDLNHEYHIIQSPYLSVQIRKSLFSKNFTFYDLKESDFKSKRQRRRVVKNIEERVQPDVIFVTFGPSYHKSNFPKIVGFAIPHLIYPSSPFFKIISLKERFRLKIISLLKGFYFRKNSDVLIFETDNARTVFNKKNKGILSYTVSNTLNEIFSRPESWIPLNKDLTSQFNILYITANYPHKNLNIIPKVIDSLVEDFKFTDFKFNVTLDRDEVWFGAKYDSFINYLGRIDINQVPNLYKKCNVLLFPSLLEVFSTTYLEAMCMNVPIVASDMGFSRDICRDAALYASPIDGKDYASRIFSLYKSDRLRDSLIKKGKVNLQRFGNSLERTKAYLSIIEANAVKYENKE